MIPNMALKFNAYNFNVITSAASGALGCKSCMAWLPYCVSVSHRSWRVPNLGYFAGPSKHFTSISAQQLDRLDPRKTT